MGSICGKSSSKDNGRDSVYEDKTPSSPERRASVMNRADISKIIREQVVSELKNNQLPPVDTSTYNINKSKEENKFLHGEIQKLTDKLHALTTENVNLKANQHVTQDNDNLSLTTLTKEQLHAASQNHIKKFVDAILADPDTNISWLPDVVERRLYINIATIAMKSLEALLETSSVNFLSHKLQFVVDPIIEATTDGAENRKAH
jgi:hypothetical protein